jgi:hypothetical protein
MQIVLLGELGQSDVLNGGRVRNERTPALGRLNLRGADEQYMDQSFACQHFSQAYLFVGNVTLLTTFQSTLTSNPGAQHIVVAGEGSVHAPFTKPS